MISRLTASAAVFAVVAAATITFAADARTKSLTEPAAAVRPLPVVVMPTIEVTGHRATRQR